MLLAAFLDCGVTVYDPDSDTGLRTLRGVPLYAPACVVRLDDRTH